MMRLQQVEKARDRSRAAPETERNKAFTVMGLTVWHRRYVKLCPKAVPCGHVASPILE